MNTFDWSKLTYGFKDSVTLVDVFTSIVIGQLFAIGILCFLLIRKINMELTIIHIQSYINRLNALQTFYIIDNKIDEDEYKEIVISKELKEAHNQSLSVIFLSKKKLIKKYVSDDLLIQIRDRRKELLDIINEDDTLIDKLSNDNFFKECFLTCFKNYDLLIRD